ncbi:MULTISPECIES: hypothetical protein [Clavibacter]|uniref:Secreted protein n=1 Tax=Clavibacter tessellarius TaxID=31965 RepID=A0A154V4V6_9MICO|nr:MULTISPECIES: hypothetical protein [Clavibacter]KZC96406.1 hypothetical protein AWH51_02875 [Clavibacter michiganensis subsp. tessellarius]MDA3805706.1 hypothetical protein [Clavibacter sp. CT19]
MLRSLTALAVAGSLAVAGVAVATPASAAAGGTFYSVPYDSSLFQVTTVAGRAEAQPASFETWRAAGFPAPQPAATQYVRFTWESTVQADSTAGDAAFSVSLTSAEWRRAGSPTPRTDRLPAASSILQYSGSGELFVVESESSFTDDPGYHQLTFAEYAHLGYPAVDTTSPRIFSKLSWNATLVGPVSSSGETGPVSFAVWDRFARPTPVVVASYDGDRFCHAAGAAEIRYVGKAAPEGMALTYREWVAAGSPEPATC